MATKDTKNTKDHKDPEVKTIKSRKPAAPSSSSASAPRKTSLTGIKAAVQEAQVSSAPEAENVAAVAKPEFGSDVVRVYTRKVDEQNRSRATGKRKNAIARVWIKPGNGKITINGRDVKVYFARPVLQMIVNQPFSVADRANQFDVDCLVEGGGLSGQAGAVKHGISKALTLFEPDLRQPLKVAKFLRRDPRVVERKKYGRAKARRRFQFSKR